MHFERSGRFAWARAWKWKARRRFARGGLFSPLPRSGEWVGEATRNMWLRAVVPADVARKQVIRAVPIDTGLSVSCCVAFKPKAKRRWFLSCCEVDAVEKPIGPNHADGKAQSDAQEQRRRNTTRAAAWRDRNGKWCVQCHAGRQLCVMQSRTVSAQQHCRHSPYGRPPKDR